MCNALMYTALMCNPNNDRLFSRIFLTAPHTGSLEWGDPWPGATLPSALC